MDSIPPLKRCSKCGVEKPHSDFHKDKSRRDGYRNDCKACVKERQKAWRPQYIEKVQQHVAELALPATKCCSKCSIEKPLSEYHRHPTSLDGYRPMCNICVKAYQQEWRNDPRYADAIKERDALRYQRYSQSVEWRERQNEQQRQRYAQPDQVAKRQQETEQSRKARREARQRQLADPVYQAEQRRKARARKSTPRALAQRRKRRDERYQNDPEYRERILQQQRDRLPRYTEMLERQRERHKERYENDPAYRKRYNARVNVGNHKRRARKAHNGGSHTVMEWEALCAQYNHRCLCCGEEKPLTKDHILPISLGGNDTIGNLQPLCLTCNLRKHNKYVDYRSAEGD